MAATYQVMINLDNSTVQFLNDNQYQLQVFKGVYSNAWPSTYISLWTSVVPPFGNSVSVKWQEQFGGYFSQTAIANNATIDVSSAEPMQLAEILTLTGSGTTSLATGGVTGEIILVNNESVVFTCGMTNVTGSGSRTPICAIPIAGSGGVICMAPYECVVLLFAASPVQAGTVIEEAAGASITIGLSEEQPSVTISYSANTGWDTGGSPQATVNPPLLNLAKALVLQLAAPYNRTHNK